MQCTRPNHVVQLQDGTILFENQGSKNDSQTTLSIDRAHNTGEYVRRLQLRCRVCNACRSTHAAMWATRLHHELEQHEASCFVTLTYDPQHLPEGGTLDHRDVQLFLKRLRKYIHPVKLRYFVAGEYGEKTQRPHYHMIIFGYDFPDKQPAEIGKGGYTRYRSDLLASIWNLGHCDLGTVTDQSMGYVAYYNVKRLQDDPRQFTDKSRLEYVDLQTGLITKRIPEYVRMSIRPGIGADWFHQYKDELQKGFVTINGYNRPIPTYYLRKLCEKFPDEYELFLTEREDRMSQYKALSAERLDQLHEFNLVKAHQLTREAI